jgi:protein gp37
MHQAEWHDFQILTKRHERLAHLDGLVGDWPENVWMGVSVENANYLDRIDRLRETRAAIKWLSIEPLLGPLPDLDLTGIDWVVVGGESGPGARPMDPAWAREIRDHCIEQGVPFFFKQWGAFGPDGVKRPKKKNGRELDGRTWDEWPKRYLARRGQEESLVPGIELDLKIAAGL